MKHFDAIEEIEESFINGIILYLYMTNIYFLNKYSYIKQQYNNEVARSHHL